MPVDGYWTIKTPVQYVSSNNKPWTWTICICVTPIFFSDLIRHLASVSGSESDFSDYNADIETREKRRQRRLARGKKLKMKEESGTLIAEEMIEQGNVGIFLQMIEYG